MDSDKYQLDMLRWNWEGAYVIEGGAGLWQATRRDGRGLLRADSAPALRDAILKDYTAKPVPRDGC